MRRLLTTPWIRAAAESVRMRTQVLIVGAGPSGLLLGQLLSRAGIATMILERQSAEHVRGRIRAGVLEQVTVDLLDEAGVGERMHREGLVHGGVGLLVNDVRHRVDLRALSGGASVVVYGQTELTRDLMEARAAADLPTVYEAQEVAIGGFANAQPYATYRHEGREYRVECEFIAGCDGYHGVCRRSVAPSACRQYEKDYPFGWLGLLADTPPLADELLYVRSPRGFALCSMRSRTRSRYYLQVPHGTDANAWSDAAFWDELRLRLDFSGREQLITGPSIEKSIAPIRSFVAEPMRFGSLFLAGDAAHIVPPTGAKGLNLAATDIRYLAGAMMEYFQEHSSAGLGSYSERCLRRVWRAERFSWWFTSLMHSMTGEDPIAAKLREAELDYLLHSEPALRTFAENYVGLPLDLGISPEGRLP
jgi:p-hydroxybenzoate 3-monooxygenase